ncbi:hypothetical protein L914_14840, partial [Phytophthora nicotianae]
CCSENGRTNFKAKSSTVGAEKKNDYCAASLTAVRSTFSAATAALPSTYW